MNNKEYIKGTIKTIVLKLLTEKEKMYGYEISQRVGQLSGDEIKLTYGALYPILYKLENEGLLTTTSEIVDNRARKYYSLTEKGQKQAIEKVSELKKFINSLEQILKPGENNRKLSLESWGI